MLHIEQFGRWVTMGLFYGGQRQQSVNSSIPTTRNRNDVRILKGALRIGLDDLSDLLQADKYVD
jgi:hypothetical protein